MDFINYGSFVWKGLYKMSLLGRITKAKWASPYWAGQKYSWNKIENFINYDTNNRYTSKFSHRTYNDFFFILTSFMFSLFSLNEGYHEIEYTWSNK